MKSHTSLLEFTAQAMDDGFDEILQKEWAPNLVIDKHTHPFDARVQVAAGQVKLELASGAQTFEAGQSFYIAPVPNTPSNMVKMAQLFGLHESYSA